MSLNSNGAHDNGVNLVKRRKVSRGKRLPWEDVEYSDTDCEDEEVIVTSVLLTDPDFDRRRYLMQLSTNTKDLESIEPR